MLTYFIAPRVKRDNNDCPFTEHIGTGPSARLTAAVLTALADHEVEVSLGKGRNLITVQSGEVLWEMRIRPWVGSLLGAPGIILVPIYRGRGESEAKLHALGLEIRELLYVFTEKLGVSVAVALS
jgi:hypothetical protein